jgi:hypothetical protein
MLWVDSGKTHELCWVDASVAHGDSIMVQFISSQFEEGRSITLGDHHYQYQE